MQLEKEQTIRFIFCFLFLFLVLLHLVQINLQNYRLGELEDEVRIIQQNDNYLKMKRLARKTVFRQVQSNKESEDKKIFEKNAKNAKLQDVNAKGAQDFNQQAFRDTHYKRVNNYEVPAEIQTALELTQGNSFTKPKEDKDYYKIKTKQEGNVRTSTLYSKPVNMNTDDYQVQQQYQYTVVQVPSQNRKITSSDPNQIDNDSYEVAYAKDTGTGQIIQSELKGDYKQGRQKVLQTFVPPVQTI